MRALLPGRPQSKRQALCTAHWDGLRLVAYISGNTAIILKGPNQIIQTIYVDDVQILSAIIIEESSGRIALCGKNKIHIYNAVGREQNDLRWSHSHEIVIEEDDVVNCLSWGSQEELLVGGTRLWLYNLPLLEDWHLVWEQAVSSPIHLAHFSNDAELVATCGEHDRLVKIWRKLSHELDSTRFDVSYLPHPAAVTDLYWRKPWHVEQSLDSLLYTICSDKQVRLWTYSDPHSLSVMQLVATVDTSISIQPRRLSVGSMSQRRYVFILDSRDFSQATERALQNSKLKQVDHAMEHLVEVANRSPEVCVVLDGVGHMSAWGLENAGCKTKKPPVVFNVALVDNVKIQLNFDHNHDIDYVRFCAFAGGSTPSSLSILVHSYTGQIDWYDSPISAFFDTSARRDRVQLMSSWSGHDLSIDHIARGASGHRILSWTDEGQAILWSQTDSGALRRDCEINVEKDVISMYLLDIDGRLLVLHTDSLSLWNVTNANAVKVTSVSLARTTRPFKIHFVPGELGNSKLVSFVLLSEDSSYEFWQLWLHQDTDKGHSINGAHKFFTQVSSSSHYHHDNANGIVCDTLVAARSESIGCPKFDLLTLSADGSIHTHSVSAPGSKVTFDNNRRVETNIIECKLARANYQGHIAMTSSDGKVLSIWNLGQSAYEWQHQFGGPDHIQKMAWTVTPAGHLLLFVSFSYHALVIGQARYHHHQSMLSWHVLQDISLRDFTTNYIGDVSWLRSGDLAVGAGNQIFVLECICNNDILHSSDSVASSHRRVAEVVDYDNTALPVFHPAYLREFLLCGEHKKIQTILLQLYDKLKFFSEGDALDDYLDFDIELFTDKEAQNIAAKSHCDNVNLVEIADNLNEYLKKVDIPQLSRVDQSDLTSFVKVFISVDEHSSSLDENALRYLYALYDTPADEILPWSSFVFASRSKSQQALLELILRRFDSKITWEIARHTGMFVWLEDLTALQEQFENIARAEYTKHEDRNPVDCSLYYLALNKKAVLQSLWRRTIGVREKENTMKLLANNFDEPRWKATALKNAYALLSRRRFEYAAAFFLLGGGLKDAVNVCTNQLNDLQLAIAITRVWGKDRSQSEAVFHHLLEKTVLPRAVHDEQGRWMAAWAYTGLGQIDRALQVIIRPVHQMVEVTDLKDYGQPVDSMSFRANDPTLSILYIQLRQILIKKAQWTAMVLNHGEEHDFVIRCANWYTRAGTDLIALKLVREWQFVSFQQPAGKETSESAKSTVEQDEAQSEQEEEPKLEVVKEKKKPAPTQFIEPTANSLLDSFGF